MKQKRHFKGCCRINIFCVAWIHCSQEQDELPEPSEKMQEEDGSCSGTGQEDGPRWEPAQAGQGAQGCGVAAVSTAMKNKNAIGEQELVW